MERILSSLQMKTADRYTIDTLGVDEDLLIERAGRAVADEIISRFKGGRVLVCIGQGNNGKDGQVVANILSKKHGFSVMTLNVENGIFKLFDKKFDIIVDCIFGTGLNKNIDGKYKLAIDKINESKSYVVCCDIPSGINADNGFIMGEAVKANLTVAIQEFKLGHFLNDGIDYCGDVVQKDIGISVWDDDCVKKISSADLKPYFPRLKRNVHKGSFGKATIFGGSIDFVGGVILSLNGLSAFKMGSGYVNLAVPKSMLGIYVANCPECTFTAINDANGHIIYDVASLNKLLDYDVISFGMGLGNSEEVYKSLHYILENYKGRLVIDADGLNALSSFGLEILKQKKCKVVLTPHVGEFARLLKANASEIMPDIITFAKSFAKDYDVTLVVKSATSVITDGANTFINVTGTSGMAKAGSGDVLSGIMAGVLSKGLPLLDSAVCACYVFGKAGECASKKSNDYCVVPSDVVNCLPLVINSI